MKTKIWFRTLALMLALLICVTTPVRAYATGAEAAILGTVTSLSVGGIGLALLAAFGVCYAVEYSDEIGASLEAAMDAAVQAKATEIEASIAQMETLNQTYRDWLEKAKTGVIELASGAEWIVDSIKEWATEFIDGKGVEVVGSTADDGFTWYNNELLPTVDVSTSYPYLVIAYNETTCEYTYLLTTKPYLMYGTDRNFYFSGSTTIIRKYLPLGETSITSTATHHYGVGNCVYKNFTLIYSNYDLYGCVYNSITYKWESSGEIVLPASEPSDTGSTIVLPSSFVGGIVTEVLGGTSIHDISFPDINIKDVGVTDIPGIGTGDITDEETDVLKALLAALLAGTITWVQYWELVGVYSPSLTSSVPTVKVYDEALAEDKTYELTDTGVSDVVVAPVATSDFTIDLTDFFPFCIPFDLYDFFTVLAADPEAPVFKWVVPVPQMGTEYEIEVDLSPWNSVAELFRNFELLAFIVGLALVTKKILV